MKTKMTKLKVELKSKDMIKPSSPTPRHLKPLKFSFLDQFADPFYIPFIFFYRAPLSHSDNNLQDNITLLKKSLSETLVQYYPLAGRIEGNSGINCNDEGVAFYEANVLSSLVEVIETPNNSEELIGLLSIAPLDTKNTVVAGVQVNHFSCGGVAVSVSITHKIADGVTYIAFLNAWVRNAGGLPENENAPQAKFDSSSYFPPLDLYGIYDLEGGICTEKIVTRRLIFDKAKLDMLKKQSTDGLEGKPPSKTEVVSVFLWKQFIKVARAKTKPPKTVAAVQIVNLRAVNLSPIPGNTYGNMFWSAFAFVPITAEIKYSEAIGMMRAGVKRVDLSYLRRLQAGESYQESQKDRESIIKGEADFCGFSSLIRFPFYEVNFGWGTPIWVSMASLPLKNRVFLMSTKCGEGIEAWVHVLEQDVEALEQDPEFLSLACHNIRPKL